jgi:predicted metal-dependent hydrolase
VGQQLIQYGDETYAYELRSRSRLNGKILIHVHPNGLIQVDAPEAAGMAKINQAVLKRAGWIKRQVDEARQNQAQGLAREYVSGETHFYLGRRYRLKIQKLRTPECRVSLVGGVLSVKALSTTPESVREHLERWYRVKAHDYFHRRMCELTERIRWLDRPPPFRLITMQRQWGSCSPKGIISLNPALIRAPRDCIEYVLLHELCHLKEHNHSPRYYRLLSQHMPDWRPTKSRLDGMAELILGGAIPAACHLTYLSVPKIRFCSNGDEVRRG